MKIIVKSLVDFDENDLNDIGLDTIIRAADYFQIKGGFQLLDLIITELKRHMISYNSMPLIG